MDKDISLLYSYLVVVSLLHQAAGAVNQDHSKRAIQMQAYQMMQVVRGALDGNVGKQAFIDRIRK